MATQLPPQRLKQEVRTLAANQDIQSLRDAAALETFGSRLPVLQAFQEFVEVERRRSQKRLRMLALSFLAILLLLGVAGAVVGQHFAGQVRRQVASLEAALASSGQETTALRDQTTLLQRWVEEARQELAAVREKLSAQPASAATVPVSAGPDLTPALGLLQEIHRLRSEQTELALRQALVRDELRQLEEADAARATREQQTRSAQTDWLKAAADFVNRQQALAVRLASLPETAVPPPVVVKRGLWRAKEVVVPAARPEPTAVLSLLEDVQQLRAEQTVLQARQVEVVNALTQGKQERRQVAERRDKLAPTLASLAQATTDLQARQQDVQARLRDVQATLAN